MSITVRLMPAGLFGLAMAFAPAGPIGAADLELKSRAAVARAADPGFELAAARSRPARLGRSVRAPTPRAGARRAMPAAAARRPLAVRPQVRRPALTSRPTSFRPRAGAADNRRLRQPRPNAQQPGRSRPGIGASLPTGERLAPADPHDRRRAVRPANSRPQPGARPNQDGRRQGNQQANLPRPQGGLPRPQNRASDPWRGYSTLPSGGRRIGPRPPEAGGSGAAPNPEPIQNAIGNRTATPGERDAARRRVIKARRDLDRLAEANRLLRDLQTRIWNAKQGKATLSADETHAVEAAGGFDARWWQVDATLRNDNVPAYDQAAQELADAEAAADQINAWQGYR